MLEIYKECENDTMDKKTMRETVRMIAIDQIVINVVEGTVSSECILENFIFGNNEMATVVCDNLCRMWGILWQLRGTYLR